MTRATGPSHTREEHVSIIRIEQYLARDGEGDHESSPLAGARLGVN